jgi:hypothetical protein
VAGSRQRTVNGGGSRVNWVGDKGVGYASGWAKQVAATGSRPAGPGAGPHTWSMLREEWAGEGKGQLCCKERRGRGGEGCS